jgi:chlorobactene glucosyltransferase
MEPPTSPVTIVVPARNEELGIEACVRSLLDQTYSNYELAVVDDRSEDATPAILQSLAAESPRLRVMAAPPLPSGWVGKCWAMATAAEQVGSEWLLFTDAESTHKPGMLAAVIGFAELHHLDMLSLMMGQHLPSFWERAVMPAIFGIIAQQSPLPEELNDPHSPEARAAGGFILIRRAVLEAVGGYGAIRGEVLDDYAMARLVKGHGYRIMWADGRDWMQVRMYHSLGEIWEGFTKNVFFAANESLAKVLLGAVLFLGLAWGPFALTGLAVAWLVTGSGGFWPSLALSLGGLGILWQVVRGAGIAAALRVPLAYGVLHPLGVSVFVGIMFGSAFKVLSGRGVAWKGRRYGHDAVGSGRQEGEATEKDDHK